MRKLVIVRGLPGSGKSTFLTNCGLADHAISFDAIRLVLSGAELSKTGDMTIPQFHGGNVVKIVRESFAARISRGETIAIDAVLATAKEVTDFAQQAIAERYDVCVVDFFGMPFEAIVKQNAARPEIRRVPLSSLERFKESYQECPASLRKIDVVETSYDNALDLVRDFLADTSRMVDLSSYRRVVHIGDMQGCLSPLVTKGSPMSFDDESYYVFHGDFLDRGLENAQVIRWLESEVIHRDNVALIEGNHEDHIRILLAAQPAKSREFERRTLPALRKGGITNEMLQRIADKLIPVLPYYWRGITVLASHAGFPRWPTALELVPDLQYRVGAGHYQTPVDAAFSEWALSNEILRVQGMIVPTREVWQVHGHRNQAMLPIIAGARSINLEGQVEFGGHQRFAVLDESGWTPIEIRNHRFRPMQEWREIDKAEGRQPHGKVAPIAPWIERGEDIDPPINPQTLAAFRDHEMVAEHASESLPHIASLNFTKRAFFDKAWDDITMHARGLFIDTDDGHVVARSYEKFFNWGERPETQDEALEETLALPVTGYLKENGFLGISGYDRKTDRLILASKSRIDGDFAGWFQEIAAQVLSEGGLEKLLRFNRDQGASCVFEVIDPARDPHIIAYDQPTIILLATVRRAEHFEQLPYKDLVKLAAYLGCEVKQKLFEIPHWPALQDKAHAAMTDIDWRPSRGQVPAEGFVIEDANGFHVKVKAKFYAFWKHMRATKDRILSARKKGVEIDLARYADNALALDFIAFCQRQPDDVLEQDIITLRNAFLADPDQVIIIDQTPPVQPEPKVPDQSGFLNGMNAIAAQIDAGSAKIETVARFIERASECPHRKDAFDAHPRAGDFHKYAAHQAS